VETVRQAIPGLGLTCRISRACYLPQRSTLPGHCTPNTGRQHVCCLQKCLRMCWVPGAAVTQLHTFGSLWVPRSSRRTCSQPDVQSAGAAQQPNAKRPSSLVLCCSLDKVGACVSMLNLWRAQLSPRPALLTELARSRVCAAAHNRAVCMQRFLTYLSTPAAAGPCCCNCRHLRRLPPPPIADACVLCLLPAAGSFRSVKCDGSNAY